MNQTRSFETIPSLPTSPNPSSFLPIPHRVRPPKTPFSGGMREMFPLLWKKRNNITLDYGGASPEYWLRPEGRALGDKGNICWTLSVEKVDDDDPSDGAGGPV